MPDRRILGAALMTAFAALGVASSVGAQTSIAGETYAITRAKGPIVIDGNLSDEGWRDAVRVEKWYEINPGDNIEPPVKSVGYLTYDDKFFYAAFEFEDPNRRKSSRRSAITTTSRTTPISAGCFSIRATKATPPMSFR